MPDAQKIIAEALCPPSHREGTVTMIVGQPTKFSPRRVCMVHAVQAGSVVKALTEAGLLVTSPASPTEETTP